MRTHESIQACPFHSQTCHDDLTHCVKGITLSLLSYIARGIHPSLTSQTSGAREGGDKGRKRGRLFEAAKGRAVARRTSEKGVKAGANWPCPVCLDNLVCRTMRLTKLLWRAFICLQLQFTTDNSRTFIPRAVLCVYVCTESTDILLYELSYARCAMSLLFMFYVRNNKPKFK